MKNADGFAARLFIDEKTQLPLMVTYQGPQPRMVTTGGPRPSLGRRASRHRRRRLDAVTEEDAQEAGGGR